MKKLRVLYALPATVDLGGIAPSTEHIVAGMRELGHHCEFMYIKQTKKHTKGGWPEWKDYPGFIEGEGTGQPFHPMLGWGGRGWSLYGEANIAEVVAVMSTFDVVVWGAAFGFNVNWYAGRRDWLDVFSKVTARKVIMIRDDHFWGRQSWNVEFDKYVDGWACVNACGFDECAGLTKPRAIIHSPHDVSKLPAYRKPQYRDNEIFSVQNAKSWKNIDAMARAAAYMSTPLTLAGHGLVIRNMRIELGNPKTKPGYLVNKRNDPDACPADYGRRIWDMAHEGAMNYIGPVVESERDKHFARVRFGLDLSTRNNTGQINRVYFEAAKHGCVLMGVPRFMSGVDGTNWIKPWEHYLPVVDPDEATPKQLAESLDLLAKTKPSKLADMQQANREKLELVDRRTACRQLVELAQGKKTGWRYSCGDKTVSQAYRDGEQLFTSIFGA